MTGTEEIISLIRSPKCHFDRLDATPLKTDDNFDCSRGDILVCDDEHARSFIASINREFTVMAIFNSLVQTNSQKIFIYGC